MAQVRTFFLSLFSLFLNEINRKKNVFSAGTLVSGAKKVTNTAKDVTMAVGSVSGAASAGGSSTNATSPATNEDANETANDTIPIVDGLTEPLPSGDGCLNESIAVCDCNATLSKEACEAKGGISTDQCACTAGGPAERQVYTNFTSPPSGSRRRNLASITTTQRRRRKLSDLASDVSGAVDQAADTARTVVGKVNDTARAVVDKGKEVVGKVNDTARVAVDRVTDVVCNVSDALNGSACANATEANETMANGTEMAADAIPGPCCKAMNAQCMSCAAGVSEEDYCKENPATVGCGDDEDDGEDDGEPQPCCMGLTVPCMACAAGVSEEEYCKLNPDFDGEVSSLFFPSYLLTYSLFSLTHSLTSLSFFSGCGEGSRRLRKLLDDATEIVEDVASDLLPNTTTTNSTGPEVDMSPLNDLEIDAPISSNTTVVNVGSDPPGSLIFDPETVTIKSGDTVSWVNVDGIPHDVVFKTVPEGADAEALSHKKLWSTIGESANSTFTVPGEYDYYCSPHLGAGMIGKIIVQ